MKSKRYKPLVLTWLLVSLASWWAAADRTSAYEIDVHENMTELAYARSNVDRYLGNLGVNPAILLNGRTVARWMADGSRFEDNHLRPLNHFYDPVTGSGLTVLGIPLGTDAVNWALELRTLGTLTQRYSVEDAKRYLYTGLTGLDADGTLIAETPAERDEYLARAFQALGQVVHVLQDMAQPAHVRNDPHLSVSENPDNLLNVDRSLYEARTARRSAAIGDYPVVTVSSYPLFWTGAGRGLADFTNAHFVSEDTNFTAEIQGATDGTHPRPMLDLSDFSSMDVQELEPGKTDSDNNLLQGELRFYGNSYTDLYTGQTGHNDRMTTFSIFDRSLKEAGAQLVFTLNNYNFDRQAEFLLPRAVGYSAGLIDHFFRGQLAIEPVDQTHLRVVNRSPESLVSGSIEIYYDTQQGQRVRLATHVLASSIGPGQSTPTIEFVPPTDSGNPGRYWAVFRGQLGEEADAVIGVVGFRWAEEWDQGLTGRHPWYQTTNDSGEMNALPPGSIVRTEVSNGILTQENTRPAGTTYQRPGSNFPSFQINQSYLGVIPIVADQSHRDAFPLTITPQTELHLKVDVMSIDVPPAVPQCPDNEQGNGAYQHIGIRFDNGSRLELTVPGQQQHLTDSFNPLFIPLGEEVRINLYQALQARGVSITAPLAIELVMIIQQFLPPCDATAEEQRQLLQVDYLRLVDVP